VTERSTVVIVDDERQVLAALRLTLRRERERYELRFCERGEEALLIVRQEPVDVLIADLRMPGMSGLQLLQHVQREHPGVARVVFSGETRDEALRVVPFAHQFLAKPCAPELFRAVLQRASALRDALGNPEMLSALGGVDRLPSPPSTYLELSRLLALPEIDVGRVAALVGRDPAMAARVLQLGNSAFFASPRPLRSIREAIQRLGLTTIQTLVAAVDVTTSVGASRVPGFSTARLQAHAVATSLLCRQIAPFQLRDEAAVAGVLHDVGVLALAVTRPNELAAVLELQGRERMRPCNAERAVLGFTHAALGGYLLGLWGLPIKLVEAVLGHDEPSRFDACGIDTATVVHVADGLATAAAYDLDPLDLIDVAHLRRLNMDQCLPDWMRIAGLEPKAESQAS
jgi:HD-like signal output (HDOD) protein